MAKTHVDDKHTHTQTNVIKQHQEHKNKNIKIHFTGDRGITVDDTYAFVQGKTDDIGDFTAQFDDLVLPA